MGIWRRQRWAVDFVQANRQRILGIPWVVLGEFWHGAMRAGHDPEVVGKFLLTGLPVHDVEMVVPVYARIRCQAQKDGFYSEIGQNDFWIAATALLLHLPLVTRTRRHFHKIEALRLEVLDADSIR